MFRFIQNCRNQESQRITSYLTTEELLRADHYWIFYSQQDHFSPEIGCLRLNSTIPESSSLFPLHPFIDSNGLVRVGSRIQNAKISYDLKHPIILHGKHPVTRLIISTEHLRLLCGLKMCSDSNDLSPIFCEVCLYVQCLTISYDVSRDPKDLDFLVFQVNKLYRILLAYDRVIMTFWRL